MSREDYQAVPEIIGRTKERAEVFIRRWRAGVGSAELVYTRTLEGRKVLLQARTRSLAAGFEKRSERISRWK